jgi:long-subunit fatty acid transport protein
MKKTILICLFFLLIVSNLYPQSIRSFYKYDNTVGPVDDFYSLSFLNSVNAGKGNTGIASEGDISSVIINPASLKINNKYQFYLSYNVKTGFDYSVIPELTNKYSQSQPSLSAGFAYKINDNFSTGFLYRNERNISNTYVIFGTEDTKINLNQHTITVPFTYNYKCLQAGVNLNLSLSHYYAEGLSTVNYPDGLKYMKANTISLIPDFGVRLTPSKMFSFGLTFSPAVNFDNNYSQDPPAVRNYTTTTRFPMKLSAGAEFRTMEDRLKFSGEYRFEKMSDYPEWYDRNDFNLGVEYKATEKLALRTGVFTLLNAWRNRADASEYDQYYLTFGASYTYRSFGFHAAVVSSSIIKNTKFSHSIINIGTSYDL